MNFNFFLIRKTSPGSNLQSKVTFIFPDEFDVIEHFTQLTNACLKPHFPHGLFVRTEQLIS